MVSQLNPVALWPPEFVSRPTAAPMGVKVMHPLIKLQRLGKPGDILDEVLAYMAAYLRWDDEDMFFHLCTSLEEAAGQVLWDVGPRATTADLVCLL